MLRSTVREIGVLFCVAGLGACGTTPASEGPAPRSEAPEARDLPPAEPTDPIDPIDPPDPVDGFPLPASARLFSETQSSVSYLTSQTAREVLAFYTEQLRTRYPFESIPNGLAVKSDAAPFVYVTVSAYGEGVLLTLTRNALVGTSAARVPARIFGAPLPTGTTLFTRTAEVFVVHTRQTVAAICDWYSQQFTREQRDASAKGASRVGDTADSAPYPYCMFTRADPSPPGEWTVVSVIPDRSSGATLVSVIGRP